MSFHTSQRTESLSHSSDATRTTIAQDNAIYVRDHIADGSRFQPGATIQQSWTVRNAGSTTWGAGYQLALLSGDALGATTAIPVPPTQPGADANLAISFTAPTNPGAYRGYWKLRNPAGEWFGERLWIDIQVEAVVKPLRAKRGNKLGFYLHLSNDQHGLWEAIRRVEPPVLLIHADTANTMLLQEIRRFRAPDAFVIGRLYKDGHTQRQMLESANPEAQGRAMAEEILNYNFGLATQRGANGRLLIDAWMSLNEAVPGPGSDQFKQQPAETSRLLRNYDRFQVAFRTRLQLAGVEAIAFNFGAGNFGTPEHYLEHFPNTLAHYRYLGFHEYGWPTLYPTDGSATSGGSYRRCMEGIRARYGGRHQVIITEAGLTRMYQNPAWGDVGWLNTDAPLSEDQYWQSLAWYNNQMTEDDYVVGACLYEVGHHGNWATFRHLGPNNHGQPIGLIDRIVALKDESQPRGLEPLFAPRPPLTPITIAGTVTGQGKAIAGATVRLVGSQETVGTMRNATIDTGSAVTWTRRVTGVTGSVWNCWRRYVASTVAGLTYAEFKQWVGLYNPALQESEGQFNANRTYFLPENPHPAEIVWDRPLTAFVGSIQACWQHYVANRVVGLTYADFKKQLLHHNPALKETNRRFLAEDRYILPRNSDQAEYALTTVTNRQGRFRFTALPPGHYRVDVSAEGYWPFTSGFACQATLELPVNLRPIVEEQAATRSLPAAFMAVAGNEFVRNGQQFRFIGVNIRGIVHYGDGQTLPVSTDGQRIEQLRAANDAGVRVVRIFLPSVNANVPQTIDRLRNLITLIQTHFPEMYILPALTNLYKDVPLRVPGDDHFYQDNVLVKAFFTDGYQNNYLPFVRQVVEAFRDEPQIFAWEIGNELKLDRGNKADENDPNPRHYIDFVHTIAAFIRQRDPNHLITTGMISTRHAWLFTPSLKRRLYESPNLDFVTIHAYQGSNEEDDSPVARELNLPFIIEEAGFDAKQGEDRSAKVAEDMTKWFGLGARGYMQWGFMATPDNGDGDRQSGMDRSFHSDWDQLLRLYRERAQALAQIDPNWQPPQKKKTDTKIEPVIVDTPIGPGDGSFSQGQTVFAQDWLNVRKSPGFVNKAGDDVLGLLAPGAPATVVGAAVAQDGLTWWPIHATLSTGATVDGWAAAARGTQVLLALGAPRSVARARAARPGSRSASRAVATEVQQAFAQSILNLRRDPGYVGKAGDHVLGQIPYGAPVMLLAGPESADGLDWWQVRTPLLDNSTAEGWVAEIDPNGLRLLDGTPPPPLEVVIAETVMEAGSPTGYLGRPFTLNSAVTVVASVTNMRASAGYVGKPSEDVLALAPQGTKLIVLASPTPADGIDWLQVQGEPTPGQAVTGWVAIADPSGLRLVAPAPVAVAISVQRPFAERWALSQGWGLNPESYGKITYDGVPLKGHNGLDFATPIGTPLLAVDEGVVKRVDYEKGGFGHFILVEHAWGESLYAHLDRIDVRQNASVSAGQAIGLSGETGNCRGAHLHFGIRVLPYRRTDGWGGFCNPTPFFDPADLIATRGFFSPPEAMVPEVPGWRRP